MGRGANRRLLSHPLPSGILALQFNSGWPLGITAQNAGQTLPGVDLNNVNSVGETALQKFIGSFDTDTQHITNLVELNYGFLECLIGETGTRDTLLTVRSSGRRFATIADILTKSVYNTGGT